MTEMKVDLPLAAVIGDVVGSRQAPDRAGMHAHLRAVLDDANDQLRPSVPLRITTGDEFQGCFDSVGAALHATMWLRARLLPDVDVRHGVGWGPVTVYEDTPRVEDGPAWWAARAAIEEVWSRARRAGLRHLRTAYRRADDAPGPDPRAVNAALICRDHVVGSLSDRSLRVLRGLLDGRSQRELAEEEGVSASAVSQRVRHDGIAALLAAEELLEEVR